MASKPSQFIDFSKLNAWAVNVFTARSVLRWREWYVLSTPDPIANRLFIQVAAELATATEIRRLAEPLAKAEELLELHGHALSRCPITRLMSACEGRGRDRAVWSRLSFSYHDLFWMDRKVVKADELKCLRAEWADFEILHAACRSGSSRVAISELGPLWQGNEPVWLTSKWPSRRSQEQQWHEMMTEGQPDHTTRGARLLQPSDELKPKWRALLHDRELSLCYSATRTTTITRPLFDPQSGRMGAIVSRPRARRVTTILPGRHCFRRPPASKILRSFTERSGASPKIAMLFELYTEHDGALLFRPDGLAATYAHVEIVSLRDQTAARETVLNSWRGVSYSDTDRVSRLLSELHCESDDLFVFAIAGVSYFVVPLLGQHQGRVFRIIARASKVAAWAVDVVEGTDRICRELPRICTRKPLHINVDGEPENTFAEYRLTRIGESSG